MMLKSSLLKALFCVGILSVMFLASCSDDPIPNPVVSFSETNVTVNEGDGSVDIDVVLDRAVSKDIVVKYSLSGTAQEGTTATSDYLIDGDGELTIEKDQTSGTITLELNDDFVIEGTETVTITIVDVDEGIDIDLEANVVEIAINENDHIPTDGLVSYYNFKGNSTDQVGASDGTAIDFV